MNEQQKARIVELAREIEYYRNKADECGPEAGTYRGTYNADATGASLSAFRIAQDGQTDASALRALVDAGYAPVSALVEQEASQ